MKRFFITYKNADEYNIMMDFDEITLLDERLIIKKPETNSVFSLDKIKDFETLSKDEVGVYDYQCDIKGWELLIEIDESDLINVDNKYILEFTLQDNNKYKQENIKFEERSFKLLEYGAYSLMNKLERTLVEIIPVISNPTEPGKLLVKEPKDNESVYTMGETTDSRRMAFGKDVLGGDLYLKVTDKLLDKYQLWATEFTESSKNVYEITNKNYLLLKLNEAELSIDDKSSNKEKRLLEDIKRNSLNVYIIKSPLEIKMLENDILPEGIKQTDVYSLVRKEDFNSFVRNDLETLPFKVYLRCIKQTTDSFYEISLDEAFFGKILMEIDLPLNEAEESFNLDLIYE